MIIQPKAKDALRAKDIEDDDDIDSPSTPDVHMQNGTAAHGP